MLSWKRWLFAGILSSAFGIVALANVMAAAIAAVTLTGVLLMLAGAAQIYAALAGNDNRAVSLILGSLTFCLGALLIADPFAGTFTLALLLTAILGVAGGVRLLLAWSMRRTRIFWIFLLTGAASVLIAGVILANFAEVSPILVGILFGVELLGNGIALIALSLFLRLGGSR
ncbi:HdeD family acid-resistance protein [Tropicimonas sp. IMCC34011]|uniref:HdeD family acid-resistance protein n=1 Tax=Tropicimonas sp. IMCC34011 TaxID=2248759 RepID=UPI000E25EBE0|nr:DUF308 domain-containing protein [Tropicimonas sp. IMCC34011]